MMTIEDTEGRNPHGLAALAKRLRSDGVIDLYEG